MNLVVLLPRPPHSTWQHGHPGKTLPILSAKLRVSSSLRVSPSACLPVCLCLPLFFLVTIPAPRNFCSLLICCFTGCIMGWKVKHQPFMVPTMEEDEVPLCAGSQHFSDEDVSPTHGHRGDAACSEAPSCPASFLLLFQ